MSALAQWEAGPTPTPWIVPLEVRALVSPKDRDTADHTAQKSREISVRIRGAGPKEIKWKKL